MNNIKRSRYDHKINKANDPRRERVSFQYFESSNIPHHESHYNSHKSKLFNSQFHIEGDKGFNDNLYGNQKKNYYDQTIYSFNRPNGNIEKSIQMNKEYEQHNKKNNFNNTINICQNKNNKNINDEEELFQNFNFQGNGQNFRKKNDFSSKIRTKYDYADSNKNYFHSRNAFEGNFYNKKENFEKSNFNIIQNEREKKYENEEMTNHIKTKDNYFSINIKEEENNVKLSSNNDKNSSKINLNISQIVNSEIRICVGKNVIDEKKNNNTYSTTSTQVSPLTIPNKDSLNQNNDDIRQLNENGEIIMNQNQIGQGNENYNERVNVLKTNFNVNSEINFELNQDSINKKNSFIEKESYDNTNRHHKSEKSSETKQSISCHISSGPDTPIQSLNSNHLNKSKNYSIANKHQIIYNKFENSSERCNDSSLGENNYLYTSQFIFNQGPTNHNLQYIKKPQDLNYNFPSTQENLNIINNTNIRLINANHLNQNFPPFQFILNNNLQKPNMNNNGLNIMKNIIQPSYNLVNPNFKNSFFEGRIENKIWQNCQNNISINRDEHKGNFRNLNKNKFNNNFSNTEHFPHFSQMQFNNFNPNLNTFQNFQNKNVCFVHKESQSNLINNNNHNLEMYNKNIIHNFSNNYSTNNNYFNESQRNMNIIRNPIKRIEENLPIIDNNSYIHQPQINDFYNSKLNYKSFNYNLAEKQKFLNKNFDIYINKNLEISNHQENKFNSKTNHNSNSTEVSLSDVVDINNKKLKINEHVNKSSKNFHSFNRNNEKINLFSSKNKKFPNHHSLRNFSINNNKSSNIPYLKDKNIFEEEVKNIEILKVNFIFEDGLKNENNVFSIKKNENLFLHFENYAENINLEENLKLAILFNIFYSFSSINDIMNTKINKFDEKNINLLNTVWKNYCLKISQESLFDNLKKNNFETNNNIFDDRLQEGNINLSLNETNHNNDGNKRASHHRCKQDNVDKTKEINEELFPINFKDCNYNNVNILNNQFHYSNNNLEEILLENNQDEYENDTSNNQSFYSCFSYSDEDTEDELVLPKNNNRFKNNLNITF